jgi:hypothetical protein
MRCVYRLCVAGWSGHSRTSDRRGGSNRNADFDAHDRRMHRADAEPEPRAVGHAGRHGEVNRVVGEGLSGADAGVTHFVPHFPSTAARAARRTHRYIEGNGEAARRLVGRQRQVAGQELAIVAEKSIPHAIDRVVDRREVDCDLIREALVRRGPPWGRFPDDGCSHDEVSLTIGATPKLVKATHRVLT